ncbi:MAG TPA: AbrB family transcriptional regulator, partial [Tabrizicola sp.]|nr:AbrB family transcriptional regulator [Tabrizicola sp.]
RGFPRVEAGFLGGCAVSGDRHGLRLGLPAPTFLGPLILSAAAHLSGWTESLPPQGIVIVAQVALGTLLGCRFQGIPLTSLARAGWLSAGATLLTLGLAVVAGLAMRSVTGVELDQALLALAPGGLTEMGLIALAIHADVAFVALHHVVRILIVIIVAPILVRHSHRRP